MIKKYHQHTVKFIPVVLLIGATLFISSCSTTKNNANTFPQNYKCIPFADSTHKGLAQAIPGKLQNEFYDMLAISDAEKIAGAEEGQCYHDTDNKNSGSGTFNGTGSYNKEFRMHESVDISYTKLNNADVAIDDSQYNLVTPEKDSLYIGWIAPGEWVNYTVNVKESGFYTFSTMYTSKFGGHISLDLNGKDITGPLEIKSTFDAKDPVEWRQAHHWNKAENLGRFYLPKGKQLITLHIIDNPVFNFDYMDFVKVN